MSPCTICPFGQWVSNFSWSANMHRTGQFEHRENRSDTIQLSVIFYHEMLSCLLLILNYVIIVLRIESRCRNFLHHSWVFWIRAGLTALWSRFLSQIVVIHLKKKNRDKIWFANEVRDKLESIRKNSWRNWRTIDKSLHENDTPTFVLANEWSNGPQCRLVWLL